MARKLTFLLGTMLIYMAAHTFQFPVTFQCLKAGVPSIHENRFTHSVTLNSQS